MESLDVYDYVCVNYRAGYVQVLEIDNGSEYGVPSFVGCDGHVYTEEDITYITKG